MVEPGSLRLAGIGPRGVDLAISGCAGAGPSTARLVAWDDRCRLLCSKHRGARRDNDIDFQPDELGRDLGIALAAALPPANLDRDIATLDPAEFAQPLHKSGGPLFLGRRRGRTKEPD